MNASDAKSVQKSGLQDLPLEDKNKMLNEKSVEETEKETQGVKREATTSTSSETAVKRVRHKSKPLMIENMKKYVDNKTLEKLNTATLRQWLKQQSIHCTTRDRKADLMEKVSKHFVVS